MTDFDGKTFQKDGFTLRVRVEHDHLEPDWLGRFTDQWEEGALDHHRKSSYDTRSQCRWFIPANTLAGHRKSLQDMGWSKQRAEEEARSYVEQDYQRADSFGHEWYLVVVQVVAYRRGVELGHASLGGVESDGDDAYFQEVVDDLTDEALSEARKTLEDLLSSISPLDQLARCAE